MANPKAKKTAEQELKSQIEILQRQVAELTSMVVPPAIAPPRYPLWMLVRDYLKSIGGSATPIAIADGLLKAGHKLGKYPLRNVKITVTSPMVRGIFRLTKDATDTETITLIDRTVPFSVKRWTDKKPVRRVRR